MEQAQQGQAMTLREQCEAFAEAVVSNSAEQRTVAKLMEAFAKQQQAVGLREAAQEMKDSGNTKLNGWIEWCEQRAREREGTDHVNR